ncbi:MAG TPA: PQQ-binding-like beta-propeller repeat protein [Verrucomicrobiota bacterium]|nr:PQQ-binding-like beta-propeller repeat protein [Verrucomicrobiota bacterium]
MKWSFKTGGPVKSSPAVVDGRVFIGSDDARLYALNLADGAKLWEFVADGPVESSPLVLNGRVYFGSAGTNVFALDAATGTKIWSFGAEGEIKSSPTWTLAPDGRTPWLIIGGYDFKLYSLDALTGRANWTYETGNYINGAAAVDAGLTAFGGRDAIVHVVKVRDGAKAREIEAGAYMSASGAIAEGVLYVGHYGNEFLAVDLKAGEVKWRYRDRAFPFMSSPAVTTDRVVVGSRDRRLHAIQRADGAPVWTFPTRGRIEASPVVAAARVLVGSDDGRLYIVSLADGRELWSYEIGAPLQGSAAVVKDCFVIGADDGAVYAFGPGRPAGAAAN